MKESVAAGFYHAIYTDENPRHRNCSTQWCFYRQWQENGNIIIIYLITIYNHIFIGGTEPKHADIVGTLIDEGLAEVVKEE